MRYYFKDTLRAWQTILFFIILLGSSVFVLNVFVFNKYIAKTELLIVANNINQSRNYCYGDFGTTLEQVVKSEVFLNGLNKKNNIKIFEKDIKVRHIKNSDIVIVEVSDISFEGVQKKINVLHKYIVNNAQDYFAKNDFIIVKTLTKPKVISKQIEIFQRSIGGLLVGLILGLLVVWFSNFRLELFKTKGYSSNIVRRKIKEELTKKRKIKNALYIDDNSEEYVFNKKKNGSQANKTIKKGNKRIKKNNLDNSTDALETKEKISPQKIEAQIITLNKFLPLELDKPSVPENLPIFVEEKYNKEDNKRNDNKKSLKEEKQKNGNETINKKKTRTRKEKPFIKSDLFLQETKTLSQGQKKKSSDEGRNEANKKQLKDLGSEIGREKKPSAHNIANGFAVDTDITAKLESSEDIKDRLNKLLRGDL